MTENASPADKADRIRRITRAVMLKHAHAPLTALEEIWAGVVEKIVVEADDLALATAPATSLEPAATVRQAVGEISEHTEAQRRILVTVRELCEANHWTGPGIDMLQRDIRAALLSARKAGTGEKGDG